MPSKSRKQAKLMRAVAHNPGFAKKVGIPQSVGREFAHADKILGKYAGGGKVKRLSEYMATLKRGKDFFGKPLNNTKEYDSLIAQHDWDPLLSRKDFEDLGEHGIFPYYMPDAEVTLQELMEKYGMTTTVPFRSYRGMLLDSTKDGPVVKGQVFDIPTSASTTLEPLVAEAYAHQVRGPWPDEALPLILDIGIPKNTKVLPRPPLWQDEFVLPPDMVLEITGTPKSSYGNGIKARARARKKEYAGGGKVKKVEDLARALQNWKINKLPQEGFFSTLDELIANAPDETMPVYQWQRYLQPGRELTRGGTKFPLKKEELEWSKLSGLGDPDARMTREQVRDYVRRNRPDLQQTVNLQGDLSEDKKFMQKRGYDPERVHLGEPQYSNEDYGSPLSHTSILPGTYEEAVTQSPSIGLHHSHFSPMDVSWSRTTRHPVRTTPGNPESSPLGTLRLIEEIQSDRHSKAGEKVFSPPEDDTPEHAEWIGITGKLQDKYPHTTWRAISRPDDPRLETIVRSNGGLGDDPLVAQLRDSLKKSWKRLGYRTPEMDAQHTALTDQLDKLIAAHRNLKRETTDLTAERRAAREAGDYAAADDLLRKRIALDEDGESIRDRITETEMRLSKIKEVPPAAPFSEPRDYATHEIRKQLLNAVRDNDRFLGLTTGADQIQRYEQGMGDRESTGMVKMYDDLYPSVLRKEAGKYGAAAPENVDVALANQKTGGIRPQAFVDAGEETFDDFLERVLEIRDEDASEMLHQLLGNYRDNLNRDDPRIKRLLNLAERSGEDLQKSLDEGSDSDYDQFDEHFADMADSLRELHGHWTEQFPASTSGPVVKSFPAVDLGPEVADRIRKIGVPIFSTALGLSGLYESPHEEETPSAGFAEGGSVDGNRKTLDYWKQVADSVAGPIPGIDVETEEGRAKNPLRRVLASLASQVLTRDPNGEMYLGTHPGIVDEAMALPVLVEALGPTVDKINPFSSIRFLPEEYRAPLYRAPQWAHDAADRSEYNHNAARAGMDVPAASTVSEYAEDALGDMVGQFPLPPIGKLGKAPGAIRRVVEALPEYISPSIRPTISNYIQGTLGGTALGTAMGKLEDLSDRAAADDRKQRAIEQAVHEFLEEDGYDDQGSEESDDEALASLGYAEGGRVKKAVEAIQGLRQALAAITEPSARKAKIEETARQAMSPDIGVPFETRAHLNTMLPGLNDALADTASPRRGRQRYYDYESSVLDLLEQAAPTLKETDPSTAPISALIDYRSAPAPLAEARAPHGWGLLTPEEFEDMIAGKTKMASGGLAGLSDPKQQLLPAPQGQKNNMPAVAVPAANTPADPRGTPLSTDWYEHYGEGPEYMFLGPRSIPSLEGWSPVHDSTGPMSTPSTKSSTFNNLMQLGALGVLGYKGLKDYQNSGTMSIDSPQYQMPDFGAPSDMQVDSPYGGYDSPLGRTLDQGIQGGYDDTNKWIDQDLDNYAKNMDMPTVDPSMWDYAKRAGSGALGALNAYQGVQTGDYGSALSGTGKVANSLGYTGAGSALGSAGDIVSGIDQGGIEGYGKAVAGGAQLANQAGVVNSGTAQAASGALGNALALYGAYTGIKGLGEAYSRGDVKSGAVAGASAGASIGSVIPVIGTVLGGMIGGTLGILYTGASSTTNQDNIEKDAWKNYQKAYDKVDGDRINFRGSAYPLSFAYNRMDRDPALKAWTGESSVKGANYEPSAYMYSKMKQEIMAAQDAGKLPKSDADLAKVDGRAFFEKEIAPKIWPDGVPPGDPLNARLIGDWFDTQFASGVDADRNPQNYARSQDFMRQNPDGSQWFDEAAARSGGR